MTEKNRIPLALAQEWAAKWRSNPNNTTKAHLIPQMDIDQLYGEANVVDIRAYLGTDDRGVNKLMLVGVDAGGRDLIDETKGLFVYDFTTPCPNVCDMMSPLYKF